jgi:hypothetical protein
MNVSDIAVLTSTCMPFTFFFYFFFPSAFGHTVGSARFSKDMKAHYPVG